MILLESDELMEHITSVIHNKTQIHDLYADLTVNEILRISGSGSLDFGGSEFNSAQYEVIKPKKRNKNDDYGWWDLSGGSYATRFNENFEKLEDSLAIIVPHHHTGNTGIVAGTKLITTTQNEQPITYPFHVPETGVHIKENARFASLFVLVK